MYVVQNMILIHGKVNMDVNIGDISYALENNTVVTPRILFAQAIFHKLKEKASQYNWKSYKNVKHNSNDMISDETTHLVCSMESLKRLTMGNGEVKSFKLVAIDEVESNLTQFISSMTERAVDCATVFEHLLLNMKYGINIFMDVFTMVRTENLCQDFNFDYHIHSFYHNRHKRKAARIFKDKETFSVDDIENEL